MTIAAIASVVRPYRFGNGLLCCAYFRMCLCAAGHYQLALTHFIFQRQQEPESGAIVFVAFHAYDAAQNVRQVLRDGKSQSGAAIFS